MAAGSAYTQDEPQPTNDLPNPCRTTAPWGDLPAGRSWGALNAVAIDRDDESVWVAALECAFIVLLSVGPFDLFTVPLPTPPRETPLMYVFFFIVVSTAVPLCAAIATAIATWMFVVSNRGARRAATRSEKQWFVIWVATMIALFIWWGGMAGAVQENLSITSFRGTGATRRSSRRGR